MRRHCVQELPEGYVLQEEIDLQKDRGKLLLVNGIAAAVTVAMLVPVLIPVLKNGLVIEFFPLKAAVLLVGYLVYIAAHEATHGIVMKAFGAREVSFGFTGVYAYAGSRKDWFDKTAYLCIALAPLLVWGIVFGVLSAALPAGWSGIAYLLEIGNVAGAAGDLYVTVKTLRCPRTVMVMDTGVSMRLYRKENEKTA